jgi:hypothetical protein
MRERVYRQADASVEKPETWNEKPALALRLEVAGFAAVQAVVLAVIAEADVVPALAENAEAVALAMFFFLVALRANEGHAPRVARLACRAQVTEVMDPRKQGGRRQEHMLFLLPASCFLPPEVLR